MNRINFVEKVAHKLSSLGLAAPMVLLLEAHKPLAFIGGQFLLVAQPSLNLFVSPHFTQGMIDLLTDPIQLEELISQLEQQTSPKLASSVETPLGHSGVRDMK